MSYAWSFPVPRPDRPCLDATGAMAGAPRCHRAELARQADVARALGSPFIAAVLEAGQRQLNRAPQTAALISNWPGDPSEAALAMRFNGALHALARSGDFPSLGALYRNDHDDFDRAIGDALAGGDQFIVRWMRDPPQTNEVGRAAALFSALSVAHVDWGLPFDILELGSSAGLNLNLARYAYRLGGIAAGDLVSKVRIAPEWEGAAPPCVPVVVGEARGVDMHPLDMGDSAAVQRLTSFIWASDHDRAARLHDAIDVAHAHPPRVDRGDAATWLTDRLALPQQDGRCRVIMHSMVLQYLRAEDRRSVIGTIEDHGRRATARRPLAWISFEWTPDRAEVHLLLTTWPGGRTRHLATCHPYGAWVRWHG